MLVLFPLERRCYGTFDATARLLRESPSASSLKPCVLLYKSFPASIASKTAMRCIEQFHKQLRAEALRRVATTSPLPESKPDWRSSRKVDILAAGIGHGLSMRLVRSDSSGPVARTVLPMSHRALARLFAAALLRDVHGSICEIAKAMISTSEGAAAGRAADKALDPFIAAARRAIGWYEQAARLPEGLEASDLVKAAVDMFTGAEMECPPGDH